jgi:hypothetical protein
MRWFDHPYRGTGALPVALISGGAVLDDSDFAGRNALPQRDHRI